jgi:hypothetical protein
MTESQRDIEKDRDGERQKQRKTEAKTERQMERWGWTQGRGERATLSPGHLLWRLKGRHVENWALVEGLGRRKRTS